jgi:cobalt-zinc-cadmium efflux system outer membrane protein
MNGTPTIRFLGAAVWMLLLPAPWSRAAADELVPDFDKTVELGRLRAYAVANNPDIKAAEQRWRAARARPSQEGSLPDPMINTGYHNESFNRLSQGSSDFSWLRFGAEQEVPFPGKLSLKETAAAREADREGAMYRATVLSISTRLRVAYNDYFLANKSLEIIHKNQALLEQLAQAAAAKYRVGEGLQQDVARAQVELSILLGRLTGLEQARESAAAMLNAVLNRPPAAPLGPPAPVERVPFSYTLDDLEGLAHDRSPRLEAAQFGVARAESNLSLARRQYYPDFVLRADYFNKAALVPEWEVGAGIRVPLYFWRKQAFGVEEAAAGLGEARATKQSTSQDILARIKSLYAQVTSAGRLVDLYGATVVPQAELSLHSASAGYQVGQVDFLTLLNSFTVLNEYQLRYYEEITNLDKAIAQLEEAVGLAPPDLSEGKTQ